MGILLTYDLLKNRYGLEPETVQYMMTIIALPWAAKLLYGIITDNFPICGSTKKNYLILLGTIGSVACIPLGLIDIESPALFVALITVITLSISIMDVVVDGLMVMQARLDPKSGS